jgi:hypothetical protein
MDSSQELKNNVLIMFIALFILLAMPAIALQVEKGQPTRGAPREDDKTTASETDTNIILGTVYIRVVLNHD